MIKRWRHPDLTSHLYGILQGFAEIADGIVTLLSLGLFMSSFEMQVSFARGMYVVKQMKKRAEALSINLSDSPKD